MSRGYMRKGQSSIGEWGCSEGSLVKLYLLSEGNVLTHEWSSWRNSCIISYPSLEFERRQFFLLSL